MHLANTATIYRAVYHIAHTTKKDPYYFHNASECL